MAGTPAMRTGAKAAPQVIHVFGISLAWLTSGDSLEEDL